MGGLKIEGLLYYECNSPSHQPTPLEIRQLFARSVFLLERDYCTVNAWTIPLTREQWYVDMWTELLDSRCPYYRGGGGGGQPVVTLSSAIKLQRSIFLQCNKLKTVAKCSGSLYPFVDHQRAALTVRCCFLRTSTSCLRPALCTQK